MGVRDDEFRSYVIERRGELLRTATLLTAGDRHQAEDLVQTTLTRLYLSWSSFIQTSNRDGYARRALVNAFIDEQRRPWRRRERASSHLPDAPGIDGDSGGEHHEAMRVALRGLPPRMRAVIVCRYFDDLTVAETADALNCSQGTVKSQTARALDHLRRVLDDPAIAWPPSPSTPSTQFLAAEATIPTRSL
jgi:RNA polymerase sigma-70 factor (sigma-E family)